MYRRSSVLSGSKPVLSVLHAASGSAERHFALFNFDGFLGSFPFFHPGSFHA
jgi:hypothetical protein